LFVTSEDLDYFAMFPNMKGIFLGLVGFGVFPEVMSPNKDTSYSFSYGGFDGISSLSLICFYGRRRVFWWVGGGLVGLCVCVGGSGVGATGGGREGFGCAFDATFFKGLSSYN
jgi:hypothetical protein